jgi:PAS domain S-box-containing protein
MAKANSRKELRQTATNLIKYGATPVCNGFISDDALSFLHRLAVTPSNAEDALTLLHELQVHQVELDLQHEQIEANSQDLAEDLERYRAFYEFAPSGLIIVSHDGSIVEANFAGADLFDLKPFEMDGLFIDILLSAESRPVLQELRKRLLNGSSREVCDVCSNTNNSSRLLRIVANIVPNSGSFIFAIVDISERF